MIPGQHPRGSWRSAADDHDTRITRNPMAVWMVMIGAGLVVGFFLTEPLRWLGAGALVVQGLLT